MIRINPIVRSEQIQIVASLAREIWTSHYTPLIGREQVDYMLEKFQSPAAISRQLAEGYEYFLAMTDREPLGYTAILSDPTTPRCLLSKLYVRGEHRGKGIGRDLVDFVESLCRARKIRTLWLTVNRHNQGSIAFYQRVGFRKSTLLVQDIGGGFVMDDYKMEKPLSSRPVTMRP